MSLLQLGIISRAGPGKQNGQQNSLSYKSSPTIFERFQRQSFLITGLVLAAAGAAYCKYLQNIEQAVEGTLQTLLPACSGLGGAACAQNFQLLGLLPTVSGDSDKTKQKSVQNQTNQQQSQKQANTNTGPTTKTKDQTKKTQLAPPVSTDVKSGVKTDANASNQEENTATEADDQTEKKADEKPFGASSKYVVVGDFGDVDLVSDKDQDSGKDVSLETFKANEYFSQELQKINTALTSKSTISVSDATTRFIAKSDRCEIYKAATENDKAVSYARDMIDLFETTMLLKSNLYGFEYEEVCRALVAEKDNVATDNDKNIIKEFKENYEKERLCNPNDADMYPSFDKKKTDLLDSYKTSKANISLIVEGLKQDDVMVRVGTKNELPDNADGTVTATKNKWRFSTKVILATSLLSILTCATAGAYYYNPKMFQTAGDTVYNAGAAVGNTVYNTGSYLYGSIFGRDICLPSEAPKDMCFPGENPALRKELMNVSQPSRKSYIPVNRFTDAHNSTVNFNTASTNSTDPVVGMFNMVMDPIYTRGGQLLASAVNPIYNQSARVLAAGAATGAAGMLGLRYLYGKVRGRGASKSSDLEPIEELDETSSKSSSKRQYRNTRARRERFGQMHSDQGSKGEQFTEDNSGSSSSESDDDDNRQQHSAGNTDTGARRKTTKQLKTSATTKRKLPPINPGSSNDQTAYFPKLSKKNKIESINRLYDHTYFAELLDVERDNRDRAFANWPIREYNLSTCDQNAKLLNDLRVALNSNQDIEDQISYEISKNMVFMNGFKMGENSRENMSQIHSTIPVMLYYGPNGSARIVFGGLAGLPKRVLTNSEIDKIVHNTFSVRFVDAGNGKFYDVLNSIELDEAQLKERMAFETKILHIRNQVIDRGDQYVLTTEGVKTLEGKNLRYHPGELPPMKIVAPEQTQASLD